MFSYNRNMRKIRSTISVICLLFLIVALSPVRAQTADNTQGFQIHFLDVGQADAAIVICDGQVLMIDGGNIADSSLVYTYLKNTLSISHINYMVSTHPHEDHVGGLSGALNACTIGEVFSPILEYDSAAFNDFLHYVALQDKAITIPTPGDSYPLGSAEFQFLTPLRDNYRDENDLSLVIRVKYSETAFLFMADAELSVEADMFMASHSGKYVLNADLIKVGHHGGETSTSFLLLQKVRPKYAVISVGKDNDYGHPSHYLIERLETAKIKTYRTDQDGHIVCYSNGTSLSFVTQKEHRRSD